MRIFIFEWNCLHKCFVYRPLWSRTNARARCEWLLQSVADHRKGKIEALSFPPSLALKFTLSIRCKLFNLLWQWEVFWFLSLSHFWIRKFSVSFFYEKYPNLGSEMWKINLQKIVRNLLGKLRKLYTNGTVIYKFLAVLKLLKSLGNIYFSKPNSLFFFR